MFISPVTTSTTTEVPEGFAAFQRRTTSYNTSEAVLRKRMGKSQPNQALTFFAPLAMAEDLAKVQLILCNDIKGELKAVK